jgi:hypothetical protein
MKRSASLIILLAFLVLLSNCGAKKPPEPAAVKSKNILSGIRDMDAAYEKKNFAAFFSAVSPDFHDRAGFEKSLKAVFAKYERITFNIQYAKMVIFVDQQGQMKTSFTWDAEWTSGGTIVKDGGRVTMVFEPANYKLTAIDGKNPFLAQPSETPGMQ